MAGMKKHWTLIGSERMFSDRLIAVDHDLYRVEGRDRANPFTVIRTSDWINVIPVTPDGKIVFIRQFRHGIREETLEIPGGAVDARDATPRDAAERELLEETGYRAAAWDDLGFVTPNPALQDNRCRTFLATGAYKACAPRPDPFERIDVVVLDAPAARAALSDGTVHHGLVLAAFGLYFAAGHVL